MLTIKILRANARKLRRRIAVGGNGCWLWTGGVDGDGYGEFQFRHDGKKYNVSASRAVLALKLGRMPRVSRHTCDVPSCCREDHLIDGTHADNVLDRDGRSRQAVGVRNGRAKLTEQDVRKIRVQLSGGESKTSIARHFGVDRRVVRLIGDGESWAHVA